MEPFPQPVSPEEIDAMARRAFGDVRVAGATEIGIGTFNSTYRVELDGREPVVLRVAPTGRDAMRNEYAAAPYFAALGPLVPRILWADFTGQLVARDHMFQALLPGRPAAGLEHYPPHYFRQLGAITRAVHDVRGGRFGPMRSPGFATWSEALADGFATIAADYGDAGLDADDVHRTIDALTAHRGALDEITEPRLLHGDLWHLNILVDADANIVGVLDYDAASWGDPMADWTIHRVRQAPGTGAFWDTYGAPDPDSVRTLFYRARNVLGARLDMHRRDIDPATVPPVHWDVSEVLGRLSARRPAGSPTMKASGPRATRGPGSWS